MKECDRKWVFVIVLFIIGHTRNRAQGTPLFAHPPRPAFVWTFSHVSKFRVEISPERMEYPWFLLVSLVRPVQSLDVSGVWWGDPTTGFLASTWISRCVNTSLVRSFALASSLRGSPSCWTTSSVHVCALQWGSGLWRILTRTRSVANVEQVVYTQSFLLKSRDFMGRVKKIALFFQLERYNPLATFLFRLYFRSKNVWCIFQV